VQNQELTSAIKRLEVLLGGGAVATAAADDVPPAAKQKFVATPTGSMFHRPDCAAVAGREDLTTVDAAATKLRPCRICAPLDDD
jgi:methylphosphotriester-DNA--protein-cysteine methyltransferase